MSVADLLDHIPDWALRPLFWLLGRPACPEVVHGAVVSLVEVCRDDKLIDAVSRGDFDTAREIADPAFVALLADLAGVAR